MSSTATVVVQQAKRLCLVCSRRVSISALFAAIVVFSVTVEWQLLTSSDNVLPPSTTSISSDRGRRRGRGKETDHHHHHGGGGVSVQVDESFFLQQKQHEIVNEKQQQKKNVDYPKQISKEQVVVDNTDAAPYNNNYDYFDDPLCGGCRSMKMEHLERGIHKERCGILIYKILKDNRYSLETDLAKVTRHVVYKLNHTDCLPCLKCTSDAKRYWRYDKAAPTLTNPKTFYFQSLPQDVHRIPTTILSKSNPQTNMTDYFHKLNQQQQQEWNNNNNNPPKPYLFEYNPSIVQLPEYMNFNGLKDGDQVVYIASFRVATTQACFDTPTTLQMIGGEWESTKRPQKKDYLGLALLRKDMSAVAEAVIDLPRPFRKREDFRLFVLHGQLFIASYCKITPIWIFHQSQSKTFQTKLHFSDNVGVVSSWDVIKPFDSPLRVKIGSDITQCAEEQRDNMHSKNLNYFVNSKGETMLDMFPIGPHTVRHLPHVKDPAAKTPTRSDDITTTDIPEPSFYTIEEIFLANEMDFFEPPFTDDRGGACCIEIQDPTRARDKERKLWMGISHAKTPHARRKLKDRLSSNQYLSRWYAFEQQHPYKVVAVSGFFCLPRQQQQQQQATGKHGNNNYNPLVPHSAPRKVWTMGTLTLDCPVIHFVTGMTEKVDDPETLILAWGESDCTPWFAEVKKSDVIQMLFFGPPRRSSQKKKEGYER